MHYLINHHCKACGLCDKLSEGNISFELIPLIEFREACFDADREERIALEKGEADKAAHAYDAVKEYLKKVIHRGATEPVIRRIARECFVDALEIIE